ncbi:MAG: MmcQ/YjbR family DNA-binding protein [Bacteroidetes bacterium]|nr:MmcQ/YjbR family DNA-binding protein [Bacteroidota bacterium]
MNLQFLDRYLESKTSSEAGFPFGPEVKVYKVAGKMFALISIEADPLRINLKCDPMDALILREQFACIIPGYHIHEGK